MSSSDTPRVTIIHLFLMLNKQSLLGLWAEIKCKYLISLASLKKAASGALSPGSWTSRESVRTQNVPGL